MPTSTPKVKPVPEVDLYGMDNLDLYPRLTRATYLTTFGEQAPTWNRDKQIKRWFDSRAASLPKEEVYLDPQTGAPPFYWSVDKAGVGKKVDIRITNAEAASINLPGVFSYPKYVPAPSGVYIEGVGGKSYLQPEDLSTLEQASALVAELAQAKFANAGDQPFVSDFGSLFRLQFEPGELRNMWNIRISGTESPYNVGRLLVSKNMYGVGAPGHWENLANPAPGTMGLRWVSDLPPVDAGLQDPRPEIPIPQRELSANERFVLSVTPMGGVPQIQRFADDQAQFEDDIEQMPARVRAIYDKVMKFPF